MTSVPLARNALRASANPLALPVHSTATSKRRGSIASATAVAMPIAPGHFAAIVRRQWFQRHGLADSCDDFRCRHHVLACLESLREAHSLAANSEPPELLAQSLRGAIDSLGEMTGAVYTNDLLDRIFSRFCIGK